MYKIALVVILLWLTCRGSKGSLMKIHLLLWAMKSKENQSMVISHVRNPETSNLKFWGLEPSSVRAIRYAEAEGICKLSGGKYQLTEAGVVWANLILKEKEILFEEKEFLNVIGKGGLTETDIQEMVNKWRAHD